MKIKSLILAFWLISLSQISKAQNSFAILQDWADYIGYQDTVYKIPSTYDVRDYFVSASFTVDSLTGADIMIARYDDNGNLKWTETWSGSGNNRDQAVDVITDDSCNIFVTGFSYSVSTNFDIVVLKYDSSGNLKFSYTLNGSANNYDIPAAIDIFHNFLYVTGEISDTVSLLNYVTIQLDKRTGAFNWKREYDAANYFDVAFAMDILDSSTGLGANQAAGVITIAGASQDTLNKWKYCTITYDSSGAELDTTRINGTSNSFDRPMAIKSDALGNFYTTGAATDSGASFNVRTAKIDTSGGLSWIVDFGSNTKDDEGNDLLVDDSGYVYVCGKANSYLAQTQDYLLVKYSNNGVQQWYRTFDSDSSADEATKMCFDNYGNIVLTGSATRNNKKDILTIAFSPAGDTIWKTYFNGEFDGDDKGTDILSDGNGNIYVSGQMQTTDSTMQQVAIKYKTDYFTVPQDSVPAPSSMLFYVNRGQIIDTEDSIRTEGMYFYTINQYPKLYFHLDTVSFVLASLDNDTATIDTLERIAMNFEGGTMEKPYSQNEHDTDQFLNYFLGHCPEGITEVTGSEQLLYSKVYNYIDVIFSNNNAGMKFQIIVNEDGDPNDITLHFTGHQSLSLVSNSDLKIDGLLGSFTYERPLVYQLDGGGNRISLGWIASYYIVDSANVKFLLGGDYDPRKPLVIECAKEQFQTIGNCIDNLCYSTNLGDVNNECELAIVANETGGIFIAGFTNSFTLPFLPGTNYISGTFDATVFKMIASTGVIKWGGFYGGSLDEFAEGIDIDDQGDVYVKGTTYSADFIDPFFVSINHNHGPGYYGGELHGANTSDAFILKLDGSNSGGGVIWANYLGSSGNELYGSVSVDKTGDNSIYVAGTTYGNDFPIWSFTGAYNQSSNNGNIDGYIMQFDQSGSPTWSSYFGSDGFDRVMDIKVARDESLIAPFLGIYISGASTKTTYDLTTCAPPTGGGFPNCATGNASQFPNQGYNGYIAEFNSALELKWTTFISSNSYASPDANSLAAYNHVVYLKLSHTGNNSTGFPTYPSCNSCYSQTFGNDDGYIARFDDEQFTWATLWGGNGSDVINGIYTNGSELFITGKTTTQTYAQNYCVVPNLGEYPFCDQPSFYFVPNINATTPINFEDAFIASFNSNNELIWSTYIGGNDVDAGYSITSSDNYLLLVGGSNSYFTTSSLENYPQVILPGAYFQNVPVASNSDGFLSRFDVGVHIGIDENELYPKNILAYPNPFLDEITFLIRDVTYVNSKYIIKNVLGQEVLSGIVKLSPKGLFSINMINYESGIYLISFISNEKIASVKILKQ